MTSHARLRLCALLLLPSLCASAEQDPLSAAPAREAMARAVQFMRTQVSAQGLYLWHYSADLSLREGELAAGPATGWVQPPGTPSVGGAFLRAWERTGESYLLDAARETGQALVQGQLQSGGWDYRIELEPDARQKFAYRLPPANPKGANTTTLDDNTTQEALRFLMRLDKTLDLKNPEIHDCVTYALDALLAAQYPNGAWPQRFKAPPAPEDYPVKAATYPEAWPREWPNKKYFTYYTFNDNCVADMLDVMLLAWEIYGDARYRDAALKTGDFMLLAQMPAPQRAWAQQYDPEMHPAWARKFEPPAISGHESQSVALALIHLAERTREPRFLATIPEAIAYLRDSLLPDGRLARFYELHTNRPLFFTKDYVLTYDPSDVPTHYSFFSGSRLDWIASEYARVKAAEARQDAPNSAILEAAARRAVDTQTAQGAWLSSQPLKNFPDTPAPAATLDCAEFNEKLDALSSWLAYLKTR